MDFSVALPLLGGGVVTMCQFSKMESISKRGVFIKKKILSSKYPVLTFSEENSSTFLLEILSHLEM